MRKYFYLCSNESRFYNAVTESPEKFRYRVKSGFVFLYGFAIRSAKKAILPFLREIPFLILFPGIGPVSFFRGSEVSVYGFGE